MQGSLTEHESNKMGILSIATEQKLTQPVEGRRWKQKLCTEKVRTGADSEDRQDGHLSET